MNAARTLLLIVILASLDTLSGGEVTIGLGPFTVVVPDSWAVEKQREEVKITALSPETQKTGETEVPLVVSISEMGSIGESLTDLKAFLIEKMAEKDAEGAKQIIREEWKAKADRLGVDALKIADPEIHGEQPFEYLRSTVTSEFKIDGNKIIFVSKSYWTYRDDKAYHLRILAPSELAEPNADVIEQIARSARLHNGEQAEALKP